MTHYWSRRPGSLNDWLAFYDPNSHDYSNSLAAGDMKNLLIDSMARFIVEAGKK